MNLIWTSIGLALGGLSAAYFLGTKLGRKDILEARAKARLELAEANQRINAMEAQARSSTPTPTNAPTSGPLAEGLPPSSVQVWLRKVHASTNVQTLIASPVPVLLIANLKGGVGKTMLAANLAAYFATRHGYPLTAQFANKRVLLIDFDYQGSLSRMALTAMGAAATSRHELAKSETLLTPATTDADAFNYRVRGIEALSNLSFFPAEYGFDDFETREQFRWLANAAADDVRYTLAKRLRSPEFSTSFDLVIIDTGPRLTTASINALVAATHVVVPTTADARSIEAAERFFRRIAVMRDGMGEGAEVTRLCPNLSIVGAILTLTGGRSEQLQLQNSASERLEAMFFTEPALWGGKRQKSVVMASGLPRSGPIQEEAEATIPYLERTETRRIFNAIGAEIEQRML